VMEPNDNEVLTSESLSARNQLREMDKVVAALRSELQAARVVIQENIRVIERYEIRQEELKQQLQAARDKLSEFAEMISALISGGTIKCGDCGNQSAVATLGTQGRIIADLKEQLQAAQAEADKWKITAEAHCVVIMDFERDLAAAQEQVREKKKEGVVELLALSGVDKDKIATLQREVAELKLAKDELHDQRHAEARKCDRLAAEGGIKASE